MTAFLTGLASLCEPQVAVIVVPCALIIAATLWAERYGRRV